MSILTKQIFASEAQSRTRNMPFSEIIKSAINESRYGKTVSIFLSHSHLDKDMIEAGIVFFKGLNVTVYID